MKIQRFAQSTFVIENDDGKRMLIDPGTSGYAGCRNMTDYGKVDLVVITHSHQDHFDVGGTKLPPEQIQQATPRHEIASEKATLLDHLTQKKIYIPTPRAAYQPRQVQDSLLIY